MSPIDLLDIDLPLFNATANAVTQRQRWTQQDELLALNTEITYALLSAFTAANTKSGKPLPEFRIPRPGRAPVVAEPVSHAQMLALASGEVSVDG